MITHFPARLRSFLVLCCCLSLPAAALSQDDEKAGDKPATQADDVAAAGDEADDAELEALQKIAELVRKGDPAEAKAAISEALAAKPDDQRLLMMKMTLLRRLMSTGDFESAVGLAEEQFQYHLEHADQPRSLQALGELVQSLNILYVRMEQPSKTGVIVGKALEVVEKAMADAPSAETQSILIQLKMAQARGLDAAEPGSADAMLTEELASLRKQLSESTDLSLLNSCVALAQLQISLHARRGSPDAAGLRNELDQFLISEMQKQPQEPVLFRTWLSSRTAMISSIVREEPEQAEQLLEQTLTALEEFEGDEDASIARLRKSLDSMPRLIEAAKVVKAMIGHPVPEFEVEGWAHGEPLPREALAGKVVLIDFWAIWCGPCVMTFPHLKEWHEEFHDQGFEIVGLTRRYNYQWNEDTKKAVRGAPNADVPLDDEILALSNFMDSHGLHHPTAIQPEGSEISTQFGVTGIPHAVLVDRKGLVRLVKVGAGESSATELRAMIEKLIAEEP